jgi:hypothetical protein
VDVTHENSPLVTAFAKILELKIWDVNDPPVIGFNLDRREPIVADANILRVPLGKSKKSGNDTTENFIFVSFEVPYPKIVPPHAMSTTTV